MRIKSNLVKLTLIGMLTAGANNALANPNDIENDEQTQKPAQVIYYMNPITGEMEPGICPDAPECPPAIYLEDHNQ